MHSSFFLTEKVKKIKLFCQSLQIFLDLPLKYFSLSEKIPTFEFTWPNKYAFSEMEVTSCNVDCRLP